MTQIACLDDLDNAPVSVATTRRNRVYAEFLARLKHGAVVDAEQGDLAVVLAQLADKGLLDFQHAADSGVTMIKHVPSSAAARQLAHGVCSWPASVGKRIASLIRTSPGALFNFPAETGDGALEVFITDWSPCPAACAVAVHRLHPYVRQRRPLPTTNTFFTGLYVRHPLTGDLLPVWVADWVKPDFGTGAVLVNPAHDPVDLAFGRSIGLPIRFALMPAGCSDSPDNWPSPPVMKTGTAVKTGPYDGMSVEEARTAYRATLVSRNLAKDHTDIRLPSHHIATLKPDETGAWLWWPQDGRLALAEGDLSVHGGEGVRASLEPTPGLRVAAAVAVRRAELILMAATAQKSAAPWLAALLTDLLDTATLPMVQVTQTATYAGGQEFDDAMRLAYLVVGDPNQSVAVRTQLLEQTESFLTAAAAMTSRLAAVGETPPKSVISALDRADPVAAFRDLHKWQKEILKSDKPVEERTYTLALSTLLGRPVSV